MAKEVVLNDPANVSPQDHVTHAQSNTGTTLFVWDRWTGAMVNGVKEMNINARLYDANGMALTNEYLVSGSQLSSTTPDVASGSGLFVIAWSSLNQLSGQDIYAMVVDSQGVEVTPAFKVNDGTLLPPDKGSLFPDVAMDNNGNILVAWEQFDGNQSNRYVRHFSVNGVALSPSVRVNRLSTVRFRSGLMDITMNDAGTIVVAWSGADDNGVGTIGYRMTDLASIDAGGVFPDESIIPASATGHYYSHPTVDINQGGDVLLVWNEKARLNAAGSNLTAWTKKYSAQQRRWSPLVQICAPFRVDKASGAISEAGHVLLVWATNGDVMMQLFNPRMAPLTQWITLSKIQLVRAQRPAVSFRKNLATTHIVVSWENHLTLPALVYASFYQMY